MEVGLCGVLSIRGVEAVSASCPVGVATSCGVLLLEAGVCAD